MKNLDSLTSSQHDVGSHIDVSPRHSERSEESQGNTKDVLDSSDLRPQNDENVKYDEKARHVEQSETSTWNLDSEVLDKVERFYIISSTKNIF